MSVTGAVLGVLAAAVVVLGGLAAVTRAIWHLAQDLRDNKTAIVRNTAALAELQHALDGRLQALESFRARTERRRMW